MFHLAAAWDNTAVTEAFKLLSPQNPMAVSISCAIWVGTETVRWPRRTDLLVVMWKPWLTMSFRCDKVSERSSKKEELLNICLKGFFVLSS